MSFTAPALRERIFPHHPPTLSHRSYSDASRKAHRIKDEAKVTPLSSSIPKSKYRPEKTSPLIQKKITSYADHSKQNIDQANPTETEPSIYFYLQQLNAEIAQLIILTFPNIKDLLSKNQKNHKPFLEHIYNSLNSIADLYEMTLKLRINRKGNATEVEELTRLFMSTFTDSEIASIRNNSNRWQVLSLFYVPPNTAIGLFHLAHAKNTDDKDYHKLILNFSKIWYMITVGNAAKEYEHLFEILIQKYIDHQLQSLKIDEMMILPGGWLNLPQIVDGHFMIYLIKRTGQTEYVKLRINSHLPPDFQNQPDSKSCCIEKETVTLSQLKKLTKQTLELLFEQACKNKALQYTEEDILKQFFAVGNHCSASAEVEQVPLTFETQKDSFNCCFMTFYILYQYLCLSSPEHFNEDEAADLACDFRLNFQKYLVSNRQALTH